MSGHNLTAARLKELFHYDENTGEFTRRIRVGNAKAGSVPSCKQDAGYIVVRVDDKLYAVHRLAWLYVHGVFPVGCIDHIDGNKTNNSIKNLRDVSVSENFQNRGMRRGNKSGYAGVSWDSQTQSWAAQIMKNRKTIRLGRFKSAEDASAAYHRAKAELHPFSERHKNQGHTIGSKSARASSRVDGIAMVPACT